jgi:hypothetical protein
MSIKHLAWTISNLNDIALGVLMLVGSFLPLLIFAALTQRHRAFDGNEAAEKCFGRTDLR